MKKKAQNMRKKFEMIVVKKMIKIIKDYTHYFTINIWLKKKNWLNLNSLKSKTFRKTVADIMSTSKFPLPSTRSSKPNKDLKSPWLTVSLLIKPDLPKHSSKEMLLSWSKMVMLLLFEMDSRGLSRTRSPLKLTSLAESLFKKI